MADTPPPQEPQDNNPYAQNQTTPPPADPAGAPSSTSGDVKTFVMVAHGLGIFFPILAPLIIWLVKKNDLPEAEPQLKDSLNFQITWFGIAMLLNVTCFGAVIGIPMYLATCVFLILAVISVNNGVPYKFPWKLDLVK